MNRTIKDILSSDISGKYHNNFFNPPDINKKIINILLEEKKEIFAELFYKTFLEWIKELERENNNNEELKTIYEEELRQKTKDNQEEIENLKYLIKNMENIFNQKKPRNKINNPK